MLNNSSDYHSLCVFSCSCFLFRSSYNKQKLAFHFQDFIFLGYSTTHKGLKCLTPTDKLIISEDVVSNGITFLTPSCPLSLHHPSYYPYSYYFLFPFSSSIGSLNVVARSSAEESNVMWLILHVIVMLYEYLLYSFFLLLYLQD